MFFRCKMVSSNKDFQVQNALIWLISIVEQVRRWRHYMPFGRHDESLAGTYGPDPPFDGIRQMQSIFTCKIFLDADHFHLENISATKLF